MSSSCVHEEHTNQLYHSDSHEWTIHARFPEFNVEVLTYHAGLCRSSIYICDGMNGRYGSTPTSSYCPLRVEGGRACYTCTLRRIRILPTFHVIVHLRRFARKIARSHSLANSDPDSVLKGLYANLSDTNAAADRILVHHPPNVPFRKQMDPLALAFEFSAGALWWRLTIRRPEAI